MKKIVKCKKCSSGHWKGTKCPMCSKPKNTRAEPFFDYERPRNLKYKKAEKIPGLTRCVSCDYLIPENRSICNHCKRK